MPDWPPSDEEIVKLAHGEVEAGIHKTCRPSSDFKKVLLERLSWLEDPDLPVHVNLELSRKDEEGEAVMDGAGSTLTSSDRALVYPSLQLAMLSMSLGRIRSIGEFRLQPRFHSPADTGEANEQRPQTYSVRAVDNDIPDSKQLGTLARVVFSDPKFLIERRSHTREERQYFDAYMTSLYLEGLVRGSSIAINKGHRPQVQGNLAENSDFEAALKRAGSMPVVTEQDGIDGRVNFNSYSVIAENFQKVVTLQEGDFKGKKAGSLLKGCGIAVEQKVAPGESDKRVSVTIGRRIGSRSQFDLRKTTIELVFPTYDQSSDTDPRVLTPFQVRAVRNQTPVIDRYLGDANSALCYVAGIFRGFVISSRGLAMPFKE